MTSPIRLQRLLISMVEMGLVLHTELTVNSTQPAMHIDICTFTLGKIVGLVANDIIIELVQDSQCFCHCKILNSTSGIHIRSCSVICDD